MGTKVNERKLTEADERWGAKSVSDVKKATEADVGWRVKFISGEKQITKMEGSPETEPASDGRKPTEADESRRVKQASGERKPTEADESWRVKQASGEPKQTEADESRRVKQASDGRKPTEADESWRVKQASGEHKATEADEGWRSRAEAILDPTSEKNRETPNFFAKIEDFKEAVAKLPQLVSSANRIYSVKKTISKKGGQSIILLCSDPDGNDVAAKVYYDSVNGINSSISARTRVLEYMQTEEGRKYTLSVSEVGVVEFGNSRYYFEIMPFVSGGDISDDGAFSFAEICVLVKQLNEIIHSIHEFGILHRDIKPQNIFMLDGRVVLGDFGVAKLAEKGKSNATKTIIATDGYAAPELRLGLTDRPTFIYDTKTDYYALGITLGTLFEGQFVYEGMEDDAMLASVRNSIVPLTRVAPGREQLENLLNGLCKFDPKYRFGYEDVNSWLIDHDYTGGVVGEEWIKTFHMFGETYRDEKSLFFGFTKDEARWEEGKQQLFGRYFEDFFKSFRTDLARAAQTAEEVYRREDRDKGFAVFLKSLFKPGPIVWKGYTFNSLQELGNKMVVTKTPGAYGEILQNHCISHWLENTEGISVDDATKKLVEEIEALSASEPELACYWFGNSFAAKKQLAICGKNVSDIGQMLDAMFVVPKVFYEGGGLDKLSDRKTGADLYGFLFSFGYRELVEKEWQSVAQCDRFNKTCLLLAMLDHIAGKAGADTTELREFFIKYGPMGIATYTKQLLLQEGDKVYVPLDAQGKQAISRITGFKEPGFGTVDELFRAYTPLLESVDKFRKILVDNPFCIITGVYETKGVMCTNLKGNFGFNLLGRLAPLGLDALIEAVKGGTK